MGSQEVRVLVLALSPVVKFFLRGGCLLAFQPGIPHPFFTSGLSPGPVHSALSVASISKYIHGHHSSKGLYYLMLSTSSFLTLSHSSLTARGRKCFQCFPTKFKFLRLAFWPQTYLFRFTTHHLTVPLRIRHVPQKGS